MYDIPFVNLIWVFLPLIFVYIIYLKWNDDKTTIPYGVARMFLQLIALGYVLTFIFQTKYLWLVLAVLSFMLVVASIIALRPIEDKSFEHYKISFISILIGSVITLTLVILGVLDLENWYEPRFIIPLAGMIFANAMNTISISAERFTVEYERESDYKKARAIAFKASLIPNVNTFFAVGLVSIPGMMTGQILSGVEPIIAVKYQIMVMCMILSSGGISTAVYLTLLKKGKQ